MKTIEKRVLKDLELRHMSDSELEALYYENERKINSMIRENMEINKIMGLRKL